MFCVCYVVFCLFVFFKQKTAYEMRISDWSSDVCSSDLNAVGRDIGVVGRLHVLPIGDMPVIPPTTCNQRSSDGYDEDEAKFGLRFQAGCGRAILFPLIWFVGHLPLSKAFGHVLSRFLAWRRPFHPDRKSVVSGKGVSVRVDSVGRRIIKKKKR